MCIWILPSISLRISISFSLGYRSSLGLSHRRGQGDGKKDKEGGGKLETHHLVSLSCVISLPTLTLLEPGAEVTLEDCFT